MKLNSENQRFFYRVAGVVLHDSSVLLHKDQREDYWVLPGGSCEFGEDSKTSLAREFKEELNADVRVGKLLYLVENFFSLQGKQCHEIGLYYHVELLGDAWKLYDRPKFYGSEPFPRLEGELPSDEIQFEWVGLDILEKRDIRPSFLPRTLQRIPAETLTVIHRDQARP